MARKKKRTTRKTKSKSTRGGTRSRRKRKSSRSRKKKRTISLNLRQKALIGGISTIFITAILVLSLLSPNQGQLTSALSRLMWITFGWGGVVVPLIIGAVGLYLVLWGMEQEPVLPGYRLVGAGLLFLTFEAFATLVQLMRNNGLQDVWSIARAETGGGYLGGLMAYALTQAIGELGAIFTLMVAGFIAAILTTGVSRADVGRFLQRAASWRPELPERETAPVADREIPINPGRPPKAEPDPSPAAETAVQPPLAPNLSDNEAETEPTPPPKRTRPRKKETPPSPESEPTIATPVFLGNMARRHNWKLPGVDEMLDTGTDQDLNNATIREQVEIIEHTLESFGAPATVVEINQGPAITQFGVEPNFIETRSGKRTKVKVGKIASLGDDLALALAAQSIRIQAPVPGKGYVGIEVPNVAKALVSLRDVMEAREFQKIKSPLRIGLGQNVAGQPIATDLSAMPHLLIAGTTGSGKSVCVNSIIACMLLQNTPDDLKLVMVDPKRVELTGYNGIPHLAAPVVVDMERVIGTLQWAMREMDNRYKMFSEIGARNIADYNQKVKRRKAEKLPYIVIVIDELADLMMLSPEETERGVTRLAQMARATGIHMVIATQRPSVDVVTGLIKANFPARIAFAVASSTDSRVILDTTGAERLLGQGDMLFQSPDAAAPVRLQGCFVSDGELARLIDYWRTARRFNLIPAEESVQPQAEATAAKTRPTPAAKKDTSAEAPEMAVPINNQSQPAANGDDEQPIVPTTPPPAEEEETVPDIPVTTARSQQPLWEELQRIEEEAQEQAKYDDELMPDVIAMVRKLQKASTSLLQRRFRIGYTRAARMIDAMEEQGIIGPPTGTSKAREVLLPPPEDGEETKTAASADKSNDE